MQRHLLPAGVLIALGVLCVACLRWHGPGIEAKLADQGKRRLNGAGFVSTVLSLDGRDATLEGEAASPEERDEIAGLVAAIPGVRVVDDRLVVAGAEEPR